MSRILVTGGSGFLGGRVVDTLLERGHSVVTTVRSAEKAKAMKSQRPNITSEKLQFAIVGDIARPGAFDQAVVSDPPLDAVIHTASPFHYSITNIKEDMLDPAVNGTTGILASVKKFAPSVKRVVITSSFAALFNADKPAGSKYSEVDWNPVEWETAEEPVNAAGQSGYRTSKALAEKEAWRFMEREQPNFSLVCLNPSLILGPVTSSTLSSLDDLNTSNQRIRDFITGKSKAECPPTGSQFWVDVRDVALAHAVAAEKDDVAGKRFFLTAGSFCNKEIVEIIGETFPQLRDGLPQGEEALKAGAYPPGGPKYGFDNTRSISELGIKYTSLKESVKDTVESLQEFQRRS